MQSTERADDNRIKGVHADNPIEIGNEQAGFEEDFRGTDSERKKRKKGTHTGVDE